MSELLTWLHGPTGAVAFVLAFTLAWLAISFILARQSGWFALVRRYPNRNEPAKLALARQTGVLGGVSMNHALRLEVCASGLRVGIMKFFGPFNKDFLVPWASISVRRHKSYWSRRAELLFDYSEVHNLILADHVANRLARAASSRWPEDYRFSAETPKQVFKRVAKAWLVRTVLVTGVCYFVPKWLDPMGEGLPRMLTLTVPALVFALFAAMEFRREVE